MSKQYLMMVDEEGLARFGAVFSGGGLQFIEVVGLNMTDNDTVMILTTPKPPVDVKSEDVKAEVG